MRPISVLATALALLALLAVDARPVHDWLRNGVDDIPIERGYAETGVLVREHTRPAAAVAMTAAGNTAYFARRPAIDLLGKMDPVVAHEPPHPIGFRPGHDKWDYPHSVGALRPAVITQLWFASPADLCLIARAGYRQLAPQLYVRPSAQDVDAPALASDIARLHFLHPLPAPPRGCAPARPLAHRAPGFG